MFALQVWAKDITQSQAGRLKRIETQTIARICSDYAQMPRLNRGQYDDMANVAHRSHVSCLQIEHKLYIHCPPAAPTSFPVSFTLLTLSARSHFHLHIFHLALP